MTLPATIGIWLALILLIGVEFFVRGIAAMAIGGMAATIVALIYMRLIWQKDVSAAFALATVFWLMILLGLGSMDSMTRHDIFVSVQTEH